jgi:hypothetical protein
VPSSAGDGPRRRLLVRLFAGQAAGLATGEPADLKRPLADGAGAL